jgi:hypothetical protein
VLDLMSGLERLGLDLYTDNYYTSPELYNTLHVAEASAEPTSVLRHQPDGSQIAVECPPLLPDYQQYMRGVD